MDKILIDVDSLSDDEVEKCNRFCNLYSSHFIKTTICIASSVESNLVRRAQQYQYIIVHYDYIEDCLKHNKLLQLDPSYKLNLLEGFYISCTGFPSNDSISIQKTIEKYGAIFDQKFSNKQTTHLLVYNNQVQTAKLKVAYEQSNCSIVLKEWLFDSIKNQVVQDESKYKLENIDSLIRDIELLQSQAVNKNSIIIATQKNTHPQPQQLQQNVQMGIFANIHFVLLGFDENPSLKQSIETMITEMDGQIDVLYDPHITTHVIVCDNKNYEMECISYEWIQVCHRRGKHVPHQNYIIQPSQQIQQQQQSNTSGPFTFYLHKIKEDATPLLKQVSLVSNFQQCDYVITNNYLNRDDLLFKLKPMVTLHWLQHCLETKNWIDPQTEPFLFKPISIAIGQGKSDTSKWVICCSGIRGQAKLVLQNICQVFDVEVEERFVRKRVNYLIIDKQEIVLSKNKDKMMRAREWHIPIVSHEWLLESAKNGKLENPLIYIIADDKVLQLLNSDVVSVESKPMESIDLELLDSILQQDSTSTSSMIMETPKRQLEFHPSIPLTQPSLDIKHVVPRSVLEGSSFLFTQQGVPFHEQTILVEQPILLQDTTKLFDSLNNHSNNSNNDSQFEKVPVSQVVKYANTSRKNQKLFSLSSKIVGQQKSKITRMIEELGGKVQEWSPSTPITHHLVEQLARTEKIIAAAYAGAYIIKVQFVIDSYEKKEWQVEENYFLTEKDLDNPKNNILLQNMLKIRQCTVKPLSKWDSCLIFAKNAGTNAQSIENILKSGGVRNVYTYSNTSETIIDKRISVVIVDDKSLLQNREELIQLQQQILPKNTPFVKMEFLHCCYFDVEEIISMFQIDLKNNKRPLPLEEQTLNPSLLNSAAIHNTSTNSSSNNNNSLTSTSSSSHKRLKRK